LSAAYFCALYGLRTTVVERTARAGAHTKAKIDASPAWLIHDIVSKYSLPVSGQAEHCTWYAPSGESFTMFSEPGEYYFLRGTLDGSYEAKMYDMCQKSGVDFIFNVKNVKLLDDSVKLYVRDNIMELNPRYIIGADGHNSMFHEYVDAEPWRILSCYGVYGTNFSQSKHTQVYLDPDLLPGGYFYMLTDQAGRSCAGAVVDTTHNDVNPSECFYRFISKKPEIRRSIYENSTDSFWGIGRIIKIKRRQFNNVLLIGDAGGFLDPIFGYGMSPAILSAYICSNTVYNDFTGVENIIQYDRKVSDFLNYESRFIIREIFENLDSHDVSWIVRFMDRFKYKISSFIENAFI